MKCRLILPLLLGVLLGASLMACDSVGVEEPEVPEIPEAPRFVAPDDYVELISGSELEDTGLDRLKADLVLTRKGLHECERSGA